jgi:hypothetical protein
LGIVEKNVTSNVRYLTSMIRHLVDCTGHQYRQCGEVWEFVMGLQQGIRDALQNIDGETSLITPTWRTE